jgi:hypothetical protein
MQHTPKKDKLIAMVGLASFLLTMLIKGVVRPMHLPLSPLADYLVGVLPNFFAATGFCAIAFIRFKKYFIQKSIDNYFIKSIIAAFLFSFLGLSAWEYIQYAAWSYRIDGQDILMSLYGSLAVGILAYLIGEEK